jgi:hypothetical protein
MRNRKKAQVVTMVMEMFSRFPIETIRVEDSRLNPSQVGKGGLPPLLCSIEQLTAGATPPSQPEICFNVSDTDSFEHRETDFGNFASWM